MVTQWLRGYDPCPAFTPGDLEFGTKDKVLAIGCENGTLECLHLETRATLCRFDIGAPVNCCCFLGDYLVAAGCHDGTIALVDIRHSRQVFSCIGA